MRLGPGALVAAAFVGPGTVATCIIAGQRFGADLLWALVFATAATIALQEMAGRLGAGAGLGLGEALARSAPNVWLKRGAAALVSAAIIVGNAAYQGGNLVGASLGVDALFGANAPPRALTVSGLAALAGALLVFSKYRVLEGVLIGFVALMGAAFLGAVFFVRPDISAILAGLKPSAPAGSALTIIALIGTTIVPYNLFLHAAAAKERLRGPAGVRDARFDTIVAVGFGGVISASIVLVAASAPGEGEGALDFAKALEPAFGSASRWLIGGGLLAAGLSSALTAPMAAGFVAAELSGAQGRTKTRMFRFAALGVLAIGTGLGASGFKPESLILLAQAANGLLLPIAAVFLLALMNQRAMLGANANGVFSNIAGAAVVLITFGLGARGVARALGLWP